MKEIVKKKGHRVLALLLAVILIAEMMPIRRMEEVEASGEAKLNETVLLTDTFDAGTEWNTNKGHWRLGNAQYAGPRNGTATLGWHTTSTRNLYYGDSDGKLQDVHIKADVCVTSAVNYGSHPQYHFLLARATSASATNGIAFGFKTAKGATKSSLVVCNYDGSNAPTPLFETDASYAFNTAHTLDLYVVSNFVVAKCDGETIYAEIVEGINVAAGYCGIIDRRASSKGDTSTTKGGYFDNFSIATITLDGFKVNGSVVADKAGNAVADISVMSGDVEVTAMDDVAVTVSENVKKMRYIDLRDESVITLHGLCMDENSETFSRMNTDVAMEIAGSAAFSKTSVYTHARESAGGRARFSTDSSVISIKAEFPSYVSDYATEMGAGKTGFDVYVDTESGSTYYGTISPTEAELPSEDKAWSYEGQIEFDTEETRNITIYFPITNEVSEVFVGVEEDATVAANAISYDNEEPIVFYGSSITQGGVATKPGLTYVNTVGRMLGRDYIDLGVWGSAQGQSKFAEYIAGLDMSMFVFDYDHNAPNAQHLKDTHYAFYEIVRATHPNIPIIFITRPNQNGDYEEHKQVIQGNYNKAVAEGDTNVYFIDGQTFFAGQTDCLADGVHPTDKGHSLMAANIGTVLANILGKTLPVQTSDAGNSSNGLSSSLNQGSYLVTLKENLPVTNKTVTVDKVFVVNSLSNAVTTMSDSRWTGNTATAKPKFTVDGSGKATLQSSSTAKNALSVLNINKENGNVAYTNFYVEYTLTVSGIASEKRTAIDNFFSIDSYGETSNNKSWLYQHYFDNRASQAPKKTFWYRFKKLDATYKDYGTSETEQDAGIGIPITVGLLVYDNTISLWLNGNEVVKDTNASASHTGWFGIAQDMAGGTPTVENFIYVPITKEVVDVEFTYPEKVMQDGTVEVSAVPVYSWPYEKGESTTTGVTISGLDTSIPGEKTFKASFSNIEKELNLTVTKKPDGFKLDGPIVATKDGKGVADITILAGDVEVESIEDAEVTVAGLTNPSVGLYEGSYEVTTSVYGTTRTATATRVFIVEKQSDAVTNMSDSRWSGEKATDKPNFTVDAITGKATLNNDKKYSVLAMGENDAPYSNFYVEYTLNISNLENTVKNWYSTRFIVTERAPAAIARATSFSADVLHDGSGKYNARLYQRTENKQLGATSKVLSNANISKGDTMTIGMLVYDEAITYTVDGTVVATYTYADGQTPFEGWFSLFNEKASSGNPVVAVDNFIYVPIGEKAIQDIEFSYPKTITLGGNVEVSAVPIYNWPYGEGEAITEGVVVTGLDTSSLGAKIFKASYGGIEKTLQLVVSDTIFEEDFDGTLSDLTYNGWDNVSQTTATLTEGKLYLIGKQEGLYATEVIGSDAWTDYTVKSDVIMTSNGNSATTNVATLVARSTGLSDGYEWSLCVDKNGTSYVRLYDRATKKQLMKVDYPVDLNEVYTLKLTVVGNTIKGYVNGEKIIETTAESRAKGTVGVRRNGYGVYYDNLIVTLPEEDAPIQDVTKQQIWFTDTFERESAMTERGWDNDGTIQNGELILTHKNATAFLTQIPGSSEWTDYTAQTKITVVDSDEISSVNNSVSALVVRSTSGSTGYEFGVSIMASDDKGGFRLYNRTTKETLASTTDVVAERGKNYQLTAVVEGNRIRCFVDGQLVFDVTDTQNSNPTGYVGLRTVGYSGAYDDIVVRKVTDADRKGIISGSATSPVTGDAVMSIYIPVVAMVVALAVVVFCVHRRFNTNK